MSRSSDAMRQVVSSWSALKSARPAEGDFTPHGYQLTYDSIDAVLDRMSVIIAAQDERGAWVLPEAAIADAPIANSLLNLNSLINNGRNNGIGWLLSSGFLDALNASRSLVVALAHHQAKIAKEIAKLLVQRSGADVEAVVAASESAKRISGMEAGASENARRLEGATASVDELVEKIELAEKKVSEIESSAEERSAELQAAVENASVLLSDSERIKQKALGREAELEASAKAAAAEVEALKTQAATAMDAVKAALRQARNQGLAGAFQDRSLKLNSERRLWVLTFVGSVSVLGLIALIFVSEIASADLDAVIVYLLKKLGFAAPFVWVGWYAAKQLGRVSKVQEDYEYKAATALAFQSYRDEVKIGGDDALVARLLEQAIETFGQNPVRLYDQNATDAVTPVQAAIQNLPPEKIASLLAAIGDQGVRRRLWPFGPQG